MKYTVKKGDTLSQIAQDQYGDANRYPEIFDANRDILIDPDRIRPGQVLSIPGKVNLPVVGLGIGAVVAAVGAYFFS